MTKDSVKKKIKKKFGTYSNFCRIAKKDRYTFQKDFLTKEKVDPEYLREIGALVDRLNNRSLKKPFTRPALQSLKTAIMEAGGVLAFCEENEQFSEHTVFQILAYREAYRTLTPTVKKLLNHFKIKA